MTFDEILAQVLDLLQREQRLSYRAIKVRFGLDDDHLEALKDEIIEAKQLAVEDLHWSDTETQVLLASLVEGLHTPRLLVNCDMDMTFWSPQAEAALARTGS